MDKLGGVRNRERVEKVKEVEIGKYVRELAERRKGLKLG